MRDFEAEKEMVAISKEIWPHLKAKVKFPAIESKQGGSSGVYWHFPTHKIYFRWNVWNKMTLAGKRLLAIHELWHATGNGHSGIYMFCHGIDMLSIELYKKIYGEDETYKETIKMVRSIL